jgi:cadmium resistance protein CadD (predicted permease)
MHQGEAMFLLIFLAWGLFGMICQFTCAKFTVMKCESKWHKTAAIMVFINLGLTVLVGLANMISG